MAVQPPELPTGTVTFLLTDIEASTELVRRIGDRWPAVAGEHRRLLREVVADAGGHEVDARGEEFFFVFRRAHDAMAAARAGQVALAGHPWPPDAVVRVRMGLHTGEPAVGDDGGYLGLDIHRTARIAAAGHGGQVLCSGTTRALVADTDFDFLDLGEQPMKGLELAERVFQLLVPDGPREFPPLRTGPQAPFEGSERRLGAEALTRVRARAGRLPPLRRRPPAARRVADLCFALRASLSRFPEPARKEVTELARGLTDLSRAAADADRYVARIDRRALTRRLTETRELAVVSKNAQRAAEGLEQKLVLLEAVVEARRELANCIDELERRATPESVTHSDGLGVEVDTLAAHLSTAVDEAIRNAGYAAERLGRTVHRGVHRQGDVWVVRHHDSVGVERLARFDELRDARAFAKRARLDLRSLKVAEREASKRRLDAGGTGPGAGGGGIPDGGGGGGDGGGGGGF
jgi:class 3 adenylate cyclase